MPESNKDIVDENLSFLELFPLTESRRTEFETAVKTANVRALHFTLLMQELSKDFTGGEQAIKQLSTARAHAKVLATMINPTLKLFTPNK